MKYQNEGKKNKNFIKKELNTKKKPQLRPNIIKW